MKTSCLTRALQRIDEDTIEENPALNVFAATAHNPQDLDQTLRHSFNLLWASMVAAINIGPAQRSDLPST